MLQQQGHMTKQGCMVPLDCAPFDQLIVAVGLLDDLLVDHNSVDRMVLAGSNIPGLTFLIRVGRTWLYAIRGSQFGAFDGIWIRLRIAAEPCFWFDFGHIDVVRINSIKLSGIKNSS